MFVKNRINQIRPTAFLEDHLAKAYDQFSLPGLRHINCFNTIQKTTLSFVTSGPNKIKTETWTEFHRNILLLEKGSRIFRAMHYL